MVNERFTGFKNLVKTVYAPRIVRAKAVNEMENFLVAIDPDIAFVSGDRGYFEGSKGSMSFSAAPRGTCLNQIQADHDKVLGLVGAKVFLAPTKEVIPYLSTQHLGYSESLSFSRIASNLPKYLFDVGTVAGYKKFKKYYNSL